MKDVEVHVAGLALAGAASSLAFLPAGTKAAELRLVDGCLTVETHNGYNVGQIEVPVISSTGGNEVVSATFHIPTFVNLLRIMGDVEVKLTFKHDGSDEDPSYQLLLDYGKTVIKMYPQPYWAAVIDEPVAEGEVLTVSAPVFTSMLDQILYAVDRSEYAPSYRNMIYLSGVGAMATDGFRVGIFFDLEVTESVLIDSSVLRGFRRVLGDYGGDLKITRYGTEQLVLEWPGYTVTMSSDNYTYPDVLNLLPAYTTFWKMELTQSMINQVQFAYKSDADCTLLLKLMDDRIDFSFWSEESKGTFSWDAFVVDEGAEGVSPEKIVYESPMYVFVNAGRLLESLDVIRYGGADQLTFGISMLKHKASEHGDSPLYLSVIKLFGNGVRSAHHIMSSRAPTNWSVPVS